MADKNGRDVHRSKVMIAVAVAVLAGAAGCSDSDSSTSTEGGSQRVIKVGVDPGFGMPFVSYEGGKWSGFQSDLYAAIGEEMDVTFEFVSTKFDSMTPALAASRIDVAAGGFEDNLERQETMNIIDNIRLQTIALTKSGADITELADFCGGAVALPSGSVTYVPAIEEASASCSGGDSIDLVNLDTSAGPLAVKSGRVQGYLIDNVSGGFIASQSQGSLEIYQLADGPGAVRATGDGTRKDADGLELAQEIASALDSVMSDGTMAPILTKYGLEPDTIPTPVTVNQPS